MGKSIDTFFWSSLGRKGPQLFGAECGSAAIWVFLALVQRGILTLLKVEQYIPSGLIFSFPLLIQVRQCRIWLSFAVSVTSFPLADLRQVHPNFARKLSSPTS